MIVEYQIAGDSTWTTLFSEVAGDANEKFAPAFRDQVYATSAYGAASNTRLAMGNTQVTVPFKWNSLYASADAAADAHRALRAVLKGVRIHLRITQGTTVNYYPNAILESSGAEPHGLSVDHTMTFLSDDVTSTAP
jgi:hypothetical protein